MSEYQKWKVEVPEKLEYVSNRFTKYEAWSSCLPKITYAESKGGASATLCSVQEVWREFLVKQIVRLLGCGKTSPKSQKNTYRLQCIIC